MPRIFAYVGCRTTRERHAEGTGIGVYEVSASGAWQHVQTLEPLVNPSYLALNISRHTLYTVQGNGSTVSAHRIDAASGRRAYVASSGKRVEPQDVHINARILSMGKLHHAMTGTGAVALAVAGAIPGTVVNQLVSGMQLDQLRFGHPSGTMAVGAEALERDGTWVVTKAIMSRSARRLMQGEVLIPASVMKAV